MILREATGGDAEVIGRLDLGEDFSPALDEVREILSGLVRWQADSSRERLDRRVIVAESDQRVIGVAAHELATNDWTGEPYANHRYLMVVAVDSAAQRKGIARLLTRSLFTAMAAEGVKTVSWLVAPGNRESLALSSNVFPEASETQSPEDRPYLRFTLSL